MFRSSFVRRSIAPLLMIAVYGVAQSYPVPQAPAGIAPTAESRVVIEAVVDADAQPIIDPFDLPTGDLSHPDAMSSSIFSEFLTREN